MVAWTDAGDLLEEFIPEVKKLFNLAMTITSIELHTAQLDVEADFLQSFLDTLPSHGELRAFSLVVARETPLVFASVSGLLYRNPGLQALRCVHHFLYAHAHVRDVEALTLTLLQR